MSNTNIQETVRKTIEALANDITGEDIEVVSTVAKYYINYRASNVALRILDQLYAGDPEAAKDEYSRSVNGDSISDIINSDVKQRWAVAGILIGIGATMTSMNFSWTEQLLIDQINELSGAGDIDAGFMFGGLYFATSSLYNKLLHKQYVLELAIGGVRPDSVCQFEEISMLRAYLVNKQYIHRSTYADNTDLFAAWTSLRAAKAAYH